MDIISAIDHATGCHQCGGDLSRSVSDSFCGEYCQARWQATRVGAEANVWPFRFLPDMGLAVAAGAVWRPEPQPPLTHFTANADGTVTVLVQPDIRAFGEGMARAVEALSGYGVSTERALEGFTEFADAMGRGPGQVADRHRLMVHALEARRTRNTGSVRRPRAPRYIDAKRSR